MSVAYPGPMVANGHFYGTPLTLVQRALKRHGYSDVLARGYYGSKTKHAVMDVQNRYDIHPATGNYGPRVHAIISHWLTAAEAKRMHDFVAQNNTRSKIVARIRNAALTMIEHRDAVHYTQGAARMQGVRERIRLPDYPIWEDCSSSATWLYWQAGAPDPNGLNYNGQGYTGTLGQHGHVIRRDQAQPGDLVLYGSGAPWHHVACVISGVGNAAHVFSHGSERGPLYLPIGYRSDFGQVRRYF